MSNPVRPLTQATVDGSHSGRLDILERKLETDGGSSLPRRPSGGLRCDRLALSGTQTVGTGSFTDIDMAALAVDDSAGTAFALNSPWVDLNEAGHVGIVAQAFFPDAGGVQRLIQLVDFVSPLPAVQWSETRAAWDAIRQPVTIANWFPATTFAMRVTHDKGSSMDVTVLVWFSLVGAIDC